MSAKELQFGACAFNVIAQNRHSGEVIDSCEVRVSALPLVQLEDRIIECDQGSESAEFVLLSGKQLEESDLSIVLGEERMATKVSLIDAVADGDYSHRYSVEFPIPISVRELAGFRFKVRLREPELEVVALCRLMEQ